MTRALVGHTPLVRLDAFEPRAGVEIHAKLESKNPGGSVKDRAALAIIDDAEARGLLTHDRILLDATSGNTGIAYAMIGAARGYRVRLCVPANVTAERKQVLQAFGADLVLTDPMEGSDGAIREARRLAEADPPRYFHANQYGNPLNWRAHFDGTAPEIISQSQGRLTHFVAGLGTSGTFVGIGRRLRAWRPAVRLVSVQPDSPLHGIEGLKHMPSALVPDIYDSSVADENHEVRTEAALDLTRRLAREAGLLVGPSSGAALAACLHVAASVDRAVIVTVFPDSGDRYLSEPFWRAPRLRLRVSARVDAEIRRHAERAYPDECCGALFGREQGGVDEALAIENASKGDRRRRFAIGPDDYRRADAMAASTGRDLLGFYHSHPDHPAEPSPFDLAHAWPNLSYPIVSVRQGRAVDLRSWRLSADRLQFQEELVTCP